MTIEEVLNKMSDKISEVKERATLKRPFLASDEQEKLDKILAKTVTVVEEAGRKISESANSLGESINNEEFFSNILKKCNEACDYTIKKINSLKENDSDNKKKLDDLSKEISNSFDELMSSEGLKKVIDNIKNASNGVVSSVNNFINKKETQENITKAKKCILKVADKASTKLHSLLDDKE